MSQWQHDDTRISQSGLQMAAMFTGWISALPSEDNIFTPKCICTYFTQVPKKFWGMSTTAWWCYKQPMRFEKEWQRVRNESAKTCLSTYKRAPFKIRTRTHPYPPSHTQIHSPNSKFAVTVLSIIGVNLGMERHWGEGRGRSEDHSRGKSCVRILNVPSNSAPLTHLLSPLVKLVGCSTDKT